MIPSFNNREITLASASPRRLELLRQIGVEPRVCPVDIAEQSSLERCTPAELVRLNARRKAAKVYTLGFAKSSIIIGADTVVVLNGRLFGKPRDAAEATAMLQALCGQRHSVYTGICIIDAQTGQSAAGSRRTLVRFAALSGEQIAAYVAGGEPLDKAGAYGIQGAGGLFVEAIRGDYGTVVGLSLPLLAKLAQRL